MLRITDDMDMVTSSNEAIVAFTADWCGPCKQLKPQFARAAVQDNATDYFVVDIDKIDNEYLNKYNIRGVPSIFKMNGGEIIKKIASRTTSDILKEVKDES